MVTNRWDGGDVVRLPLFFLEFRAIDIGSEMEMEPEQVDEVLMLFSAHFRGYLHFLLKLFLNASSVLLDFINTDLFINVNDFP